MAKDFFDEDLVDKADGGARRPGAADPSFHSQQKRVLPEQVGQTADEIERLRQRQEELERRKQALVEQRRRVESYEHGRREMLDKLGRSGVMVVREGEQASRMAALCAETGALFQRLHKEIEGIAPDQWSEAEYDRELTRALAQIDSAAAEYRRAMDRVNATAWHRGAQEGGAADLSGAPLSGGVAPHSFTHWLLAGFAFSLPVIAILVVLFVVYVVAVARGGG